MRLYEKVTNVVIISAVVMALVVLATVVKADSCNDALKEINYNMDMYKASGDKKVYAQRAYLATVDALVECHEKYHVGIEDTRELLKKEMK